MIADQPGGAELQSYAYAAQVLLLVVLVPLYGALATHLPRRRLINAVTAFFIGSQAAVRRDCLWRFDPRGPASRRSLAQYQEADLPIGAGNAFALVLRNRYVLLMALQIFLLN